MESQSPETTEAPETPVDLFLAPVRPGRPPSSMSTSEPQPSSTNPPPSPLPAEPSTSPDPNSSTRPPREAPAPGPGTAPAGSSPSEDDDRPRSLKDTIASTITGATSVAHNTLTDDVGRAHHLYLATEDEVEAVAESASAIISRRLGPVVGSSELADVVQLAIAVGSYATRTWQSWRAARTTRAELLKKQQASQQNGQ